MSKTTSYTYFDTALEKYADAKAAQAVELSKASVFSIYVKSLKASRDKKARGNCCGD